MANDDDGSFRLSRRKALAGLGSIGMAGALGVGGTYAQFTDTEEDTLIFSAGGIDATVEYGASYNGNDVQSFNGGSSAGSLENVEVVEGEECGGLGFNLADVKPGDYGCFTFRFKLENNPSWGAACIGVGHDLDGEDFEPENEIEGEPGDYKQGPDPLLDKPNNIHPDTGAPQTADADYYGRKGIGELAENILVIPFYKQPVDQNTSEKFDPCVFFDEDTETFDPDAYEGSEAVGTATEFWDNAQDQGQGLHPLPLRDAARTSMIDTTMWGSNGNVIQAFSPPDAIVGEDCFFLNGVSDDETDNQQEATPLEPGTYYQMGWDWHLPFDTGNEVQGDTLQLQLGFTFGQTRHTESPKLSNVFAPGQNTPNS